jgi:hypothetical protein
MIPNGILIAIMFQAQLLLSIGFTLNVILAEGTEDITANNEQDRTIESSRGVFSHIVEDIIVPPLKSAADRVDSMLKAIYPGKLCTRIYCG